MNQREEERRLEKLYGGPKVCVICGKTFTGLGNDPAPVVMPRSHVEDVDRRCCDECNETRVIPKRQDMLARGETWEGYKGKAQISVDPQQDN
jgi:hypothetical protein